MEVNNHHVFFVRSWYKSPMERALRTHTGLVIPMFVEPHKDLHANVDPPPKPNSKLIIGALSLLDSLPNKTLSNPPDTLLALTEHFLSQDSNLSQRIGHNLVKQAGYVLDGYYS